MLKIMGKKIFTIYAENVCLSKPMLFLSSCNVSDVCGIIHYRFGVLLHQLSLIVTSCRSLMAKHWCNK